MTCGFVSIRLRPLMYVKLTHKSVTYVSGTFVTLDTGLNKGGLRGIFFTSSPVHGEFLITAASDLLVGSGMSVDLI